MVVRRSDATVTNDLAPVPMSHGASNTSSSDESGPKWPLPDVVAGEYTNQFISN